MSELEPLSRHDRFRAWTAAQPWANGTVCFSSVLDDLICGIDSFRSEPRPKSFRRWTDSVAIGCVPWMNHPGIIDAFARVDGCCVVMSKGATDLNGARQLNEIGRPVGGLHLPNFDEIGPVGIDGSPPVIGPYGMNTEPVESLGPVRLAGWRNRPRSAPMLHAKMLVLGDAHGWDDDEGPDWGGSSSIRATSSLVRIRQLDARRREKS